jgi:hypothetical protein
MMIDIHDRLDYLNDVLISMDWSKIVIEIQRNIDDLTAKLIRENNEETRGAIKALKQVLELKQTFQYEQQQIKESFSNTDS